MSTESEDWRHRLVALPSERLRVGDVLRFTLRDEQGRVLLAKGLKIENRHDLQRLQARPQIFVEYEESDEAIKVLMQGLTEADKRDAPLGELDRYIQLSATASEASNPARSVQQAPSHIHQAWAELEQRLGALLTTLGQYSPHATEAALRLGQQIVPHLLALLQHDRDGSVWCLFYRAVTSYSGYSAMHALQTAALCQLLTEPLALPENERSALIPAALTMNVAMKNLQDILATQKAPLSPSQRTQVDRHPREGVRLLQAAGVSDPLWLDAVLHHHASFSADAPLASLTPGKRLARIIQVVDRYTAALSPRLSRAGRDGKEATRTVVLRPGSSQKDEVGMALMLLLGLYPPGTFVKLSSGETAVVLKKGTKPNEPLVATVLNKQGDPVMEPKLRHTASAEFAVLHGIAGSSVKVRLPQEHMLKLMRSARA